MDAISIRLAEELKPQMERLQRNDHRTFLPLRWRKVVELHLCNRTAEEIARETGFSKAYVGVLLRRPEVVAWKQQIMAVTQLEFEALFAKVVTNLSNQLDSKDVPTQMEAQNQWLRANGKYSNGNGKSAGVVNNVTAEEVVFQILNGDVNE